MEEADECDPGRVELTYPDAAEPRVVCGRSFSSAVSGPDPPPEGLNVPLGYVELDAGWVFGNS